MGKEKDHDMFHVIDVVQVAICLISIISAAAIFMSSIVFKDNRGLPENLDDMCSEFSEEYNQLLEYENDISSISPEKAYTAKSSLDDQADNYLKSFNYWENPSKQAKEKISGDARTKIIIDHIYNKSCEPYWKYTETVRPILIENLKKSKK